MRKNEKGKYVFFLILFTKINLSNKKNVFHEYFSAIFIKKVFFMGYKARF